MLLYHGTSLKNGEQILESGLLPRRSRPSNWVHCGAPSRPDCVYLTTVWAGYFAAHVPKSDKGWAILEINSDRLNLDHLLPDEDCLAQIQWSEGAQEAFEKFGASDVTGLSAYFKRYLKNYSPALNRPQGERQLLWKEGRPFSWQNSLDLLGTCAHFGGISASAITRALFVRNPLQSPWLMTEWLNPSITIDYYRHGGRERYETLTRAMFAAPDRRDLPEIAFVSFGGRQEWIDSCRLREERRRKTGQQKRSTLSDEELVQEKLDATREMFESANLEVRDYEHPMALAA